MAKSESCHQEKVITTEDVDTDYRKSKRETKLTKNEIVLIINVMHGDKKCTAI